MKFNENVIELLDSIHEMKNKKINGYLIEEKEGFIIRALRETLFKIDKKSVVLLDSINLQSKIYKNIERKFDVTSNIEKFDSFLEELSDSIIRLNHLGFGYFCTSIEEEINELLEKIKKSRFKIYEEDSGDKNNRWFFVGNIQKLGTPMIEIVLEKSLESKQNEWKPHMQIDLDTSLTEKEIILLTNEFFGENFLNWKLEIPNYGIILLMGRLGVIDGINVYIGLGTNLRKSITEVNEIFKEI